MSLIGSLEDLSLGDILQIISLSQKSGVLVLRSDEGEGRIAFRGGLVSGAVVKDGPQDLRAVLVGGGFLDAAVFDAAVSAARAGGTVEDALIGAGHVDAARLDSLRRETVEAAVVTMFRWGTGEFSFDVREEPDPEDPQLVLPIGVNAQYLAMEGARQDDEVERDPVAAADEMSAHEMFGVEPEPEDGEGFAPEPVVETVAAAPARDLFAAGIDTGMLEGDIQPAVLESEAHDTADSAALDATPDSDLLEATLEPDALDATVESELLDAASEGLPNPAPLDGAPASALLEAGAALGAASSATSLLEPAPLLDTAPDFGSAALEIDPVVGEPILETDAALPAAGSLQGEALSPPANDSGPAPGEGAVDLIATAAAHRASPDFESIEDSEAPQGSAAAVSPPAEIVLPVDFDKGRPVIVIDDELPALEWAKVALAGVFDRVHIFQRSDLGLTRIRQYLARAVNPILLLSPDTPGDRLAGIDGAVDFVRRLKEQAPRICVVWMVEDGQSAPKKVAPADAVGARPAGHHLRYVSGQQRSVALGAALRELLFEVATERSATPPVEAETLDGLKQVTARLHDAAERGEVLPVVIEFASRSFGRVALFAIHKGEAAAIASHGLERCGGPVPTGLRDVAIPIAECAWFGRLLEQKRAMWSPPQGPGDERLARALGDRVPQRAYLAPIESGGEVVACLYADDLPGGDGPADTSALEVVLHHAGLALDRAALERALAEVEAERSSEAGEQAAD